MPPALLGSTAPAPANTGGSTPRADSTSGSRRDFDALLKADAGSTAEPSRKPSAKTPASANTAPPPDAGQSAPGDKSAAPTSPADGSDTSTESSTPATTPTSKADSSEPADPTDAAPWPPLGLAGLALSGLDPQAAVAAPSLPATATPVATAPLLGAAATATPVAAPALPGTAGTAPATDGAAAPGPIALPQDIAETSDDSLLLKTVTEAVAAANDDGGDAPATPLLHALHAVAELKSATTTSALTASPTVPPHVGGEDFDDAIGARIGWLADQKIGHAVIKVTPHDLGQIEVRLQMDGDKVHASFSSAHAEVRHALESSIPRLREMLNEQGFQLGNADVGQQHTAQDGNANGSQAARGGDDGEPALADVTLSPAQLMRQRGLVDAYA